MEKLSCVFQPEFSYVFMAMPWFLKCISECSNELSGKQHVLKEKRVEEWKAVYAVDKSSHSEIKPGLES